MNKPLSVTALNTQIKSLLETTFISTYVEGEISNLTYHNSGHIYFSIKDENSTISCVMFKGNTKYLKFRLEVGQKVVITGSLTVYTPRGSYQLICNRITPSGIGELTLAYEQLKKRLQEKGYFNPEFKKTLPSFPKEIVIVTSPTGAAIEDMKKVASKRWPLAKIKLIKTLVQGDGAAFDIASSIKYGDKLNADLMIVGRGGGSIEDLWAFNEEIVADAIFNANTPIISAVGHESDFVISDFVADVRASTPSNAIEIALPDINEFRIYLDNIYNEYKRAFSIILRKKEQELSNIKLLFSKNSFESKFAMMQTQINELRNSYNSVLSQTIKNKEMSLKIVKENYIMNAPEKRDKRGFAQVTQNGKIIELKKLEVGQNYSIEDSKTKIYSEVIKIINH